MKNRFVQETILEMNKVSFDRLKAALVGKYISFHVVTTEEITRNVFGEKILDFFEKLQYKTGKKFEEQIKSYMTMLDSVVEPHVAKAPQAKKSEPVPVTPRARKYYEKATEIRKSLKSVQELLDYSRLMMCLYAAIINSGGETIDNLDFSIGCLDPDVIEYALKAEKENVLFGKNPKPQFDTSNPYSMDNCFFVIAIIMLYTIIGDSLEEGLDNE